MTYPLILPAILEKTLQVLLVQGASKYQNEEAKPVLVTAYWVNRVLRIDIKGLQGEKN